MFNRTTINLLFSIYFGLLILVADLAIYILSVFLYIFQNIRKWGTFQLRAIAGQLRNISNRANSRPRRLSGPNGTRPIGLSQDPFADLSTDFFLNPTHPGSPRLSRSRRRTRGETTPSRPLSSRPARRPRRLLAARPLSLSPPPTYSEQGPIQDQIISTAEVRSASTSKVKKKEAEQPLLTSPDQSQAQLPPATPPIGCLSLVETPATPPIGRLSLVETPPLSSSPIASDSPEAEV